MSTRPQVSVLFARADSVYKNIPECDVYDIQRDARTKTGALPIIAHPPCRAWGRLRHFAKPRYDEKELATWAIDQIRQFGGVLEHPKGSKLWEVKNLPLGLEIDAFGGYTIDIDQFWFGHRAQKKTWLYIVGVERSQLPPVSLRFDAVTHVINTTLRKGKKRPEVSKAEREHTPEALALWLVNVAKMCKPTLK